MSAYYNEHEPYAAQWLRNLITAGHIAPGDVDERDIQDVQPDDLRGYTQCHFFAGIGGWSYALRLAGWPDDRPVWTGSCPCQPFSSAGKGDGFHDSRHLWPSWFRLIRECAPPIVFGEQVARAAGLGWFDTVSTDLEDAAYAIGAADLCAAGVGAPHIRQRIWFVADSDERRRRSYREHRRRQASSGGRPLEPHMRSEAQDAGAPGDVGDTGGQGLSERVGVGRLQRGQVGALAGQAAQCRSDVSVWSGVEWLPCRDGKARPVEPGTFPLAHGVSGRVGRLRGYGNAIVPQVAAEFIVAATEAMNG